MLEVVLAPFQDVRVHEVLLRSLEAADPATHPLGSPGHMESLC